MKSIRNAGKIDKREKQREFDKGTIKEPRGKLKLFWENSYYLGVKGVSIIRVDLLTGAPTEEPRRIGRVIGFLIKQLVANSKKIGGSAAGQTKRIVTSLHDSFEMRSPPCVSASQRTVTTRGS